MRERGCFLTSLSLFGLVLGLLILPFLLGIGHARADEPTPKVTFESFRAEMIDRAPYCAAIYNHLSLETTGEESANYQAYYQQAMDMYAEYSLKMGSDAEQDIRDIGNQLGLLVLYGEMDEEDYVIKANTCNDDLNRLIEEETALGF